MKAKKIICLILAILLGLGVLSPLLSLFVSAAEPVKIECEASYDTSNRTTIRKGNTAEVTLSVTDYGYAIQPGDKVMINGLYSTSAFTRNWKDGDNLLVGEPKAAGAGTTYTVKLPVRYSGKGNTIAFDIAVYRDSDPMRVLKCSATIPNVEEYVEETSEEEKDPDPLTPYIIVESYTYGGDSVYAGSNFTLDLKLKNTSESHTLENIVMNLSPQGVFSMGSSSNTIYIPTLFAGSTITKQITINTGLTKVTDDEDANSIGMKFEYQYVNDKIRKSGSSSENITIPVTFPDRFEISPPEMDEMAFEGEDWYIYLPMVNKGRSSVYNLMAYVEGEGISNAGQRQYVGNLNAGSESGVDFTLKFDSPGKKTGNIVVTYEDTNMNPKTLTTPFEVEVQGSIMPDDEFPTDGDMPIEPFVPSDTDAKESGIPKTPIVVTAIIVCLISAYITVLKAKAKRSIFTDEEI